MLPRAFIPRRDVKPVAGVAERQFGSLSAILAAPAADRVKVGRVGESVAPA